MRSTHVPPSPAARPAASPPGGAEELVGRHEAGLRRLLRRITGDPQTAEDVLQEVWLIAFQSLGRFRGEARLGTWLARIAVREGLRARDRGRTRSWRTSALEPGMRGEPEVGGPGPLALASMRDELDVLLARLPEKGRAAFVLSTCGWSYAEVAELLERPSGTVATWIHRARRELARRPA